MDERLPTLAVGSYEPTPAGRDFQTEMNRLRSQADLSWPVEQQRLKSLGITDGMRIVEVGCGPGFITRRLAEWLPNSAIISIDVDARMLEVARRTLTNAAIGSRVSLLCASALATGLKPDTFDVAISRYVFQHLPHPVAAAAEVLRILKPGGSHVVIDVDDGLWGIAEPAFDEFRTWHAHRPRMQALRGGNRFIGRQLGRILRNAGYGRVQLDLFGYHSDDLGLPEFDSQLTPEQFFSCVESGRMTLEDYVRAGALYQRFLDTPDAFVLMVGFIARAEKI